MSIKRNFLYNVCYQFLALFLPLITTPYISRVMGVEGIGIYSYVYSITNYFTLFSMLGLNNYGNRSIAAVRDNKQKLSEVFFNIYSIQVIATATMFLIYLGCIHLFISENQLIFYIQLLFIISTALDINWFFFGLEQFKLTVTRNTIIKLLTVTSIFIFVRDKQDLWLYTLIMATGTLLSQIFLWIFIRKYINWSKPSIKEIKKHIKPNLILFIPVLAVSIYKIMDKIMLGYMTDVLQVGYYENSEKIINIPICIIGAVGVVMLPRMTNLKSRGEYESSKYYIEKSLKFVMFIAIGSMAGLIGLAPSFIPLFLGNDFLECVLIVSLLAITVLFISWANVIRTQYLIPQEKDSIFMKASLVGAIINFIINLFLIPKYGAVGAAIGTIFAELSVAVYQTVKVGKELDIRRYLINTCIFIFPAICMYFVLVLLNHYLMVSIITIVLKIILGGIIYIIFSIIGLFIFDKNFKLKIERIKVSG